MIINYKYIAKKHNFKIILNNKMFFIADLKLSEKEFRRLLGTKNNSTILDYTLNYKSSFGMVYTVEGEFIRYHN